MEKSSTRTVIRVIGVISILAGLYHLYSGKDWLEWAIAFFLGASLYGSTYMKSE